MQETLNLKIKYRESFRPFAPSVLREDLTDWFELDYDSPYMLLVDDVKKDQRIEMTKEEKEEGAAASSTNSAATAILPGYILSPEPEIAGGRINRRNLQYLNHNF